MSNILKIEAFSGASGDMFLGAFAGLSGNYDDLLNLPSLLNFDQEAKVEIKDVSKNGISCKQVSIKELKEQKDHRHLNEINKIIEASKLSEGAKLIALDIFEIIGKAESEVHKIPFEKVHFHEVGAVDSIIDVCGAAYFIDKLGIEETYLSSLISGRGFVKTAHGLLPVPAPATKMILEGIPYSQGDEDGEKLTPTGAAIIKYLNPKFTDVALTSKKTSYGSGEKDFAVPNVLRLSLCDSNRNEEELLIVETNIDDGNPEFLGSAFQKRLLEIGAYDFYFTQIIMKKGRPGLLLSIICSKTALAEISDFILNYTTTIGLRYFPTERIELERKIETVETDLGTFRVKISKTKGGIEKVKPESDDVINCALKKGIAPNEISNKIIKAYHKKIDH